MWNELKKEESKLKDTLESLKKHGNAIHMKIIRLNKWLENNGYTRPFNNSNDINLIKLHKMINELSQVDIEINDVKIELSELQHDIYYMSMGYLISAYKGMTFKVVQIDNNNKAIEEIYCDNYSKYLGNQNMILVYELIRGIGKLPYEKLIHIQEGINNVNNEL